MRIMKRMTFTALMLLLVHAPAVLADGKREDKAKQEIKQEKIEGQRAEIDTMARVNLDRLFVEDPDAKAIHDKSYGYAVFDTTKIALGLSGGGGAGVAVSKKDGKRVYMRMATVGIGVGVGAQNYQVIFFFEDKGAFDHFVSEEWNSEASADAGAGDHGASSSGTAARGITIFKLADEGLMVNADLSGTRFWKADKLNS